MGPLAQLAEAQGADFSGLNDARLRSLQELERITKICSDVDLGEEIGVAVMGSLGRHEQTVKSDVDFAVFSLQDQATNEDRQAIADALEAAAYSLPSGTGPMSKPVHIAPLRDHIGKDVEEPRELTMRMLLLLESLPLRNQDLHQLAVSQILGLYFKDPIKSFQPPRFLLNDVVRYWRTICVDFEGKMAMRANEGWVIRNAKLRTLRKMLFAGGLIPLLECHTNEAREVPDFLAGRFSLRPADRLAAAALAFDAAGHGARALEAYSTMLDLLHDPERREELDIMELEDRSASKVWDEVVELGDEFDVGLVGLLFETDLAETTKRYGLF